jgi:hypothetical protein
VTINFRQGLRDRIIGVAQGPVINQNAAVVLTRMSLINILLEMTVYVSSLSAATVVFSAW